MREPKKKKLEGSSLAMRHKKRVCESKEKQIFFFSCETYTKGFVIVFGGSQVRRKLENYFN